MSHFSEADLAQMNASSQTAEQIERQLALFEKGTHFLRLHRPAVVNDGIIQMDDTDIARYTAAFDDAREKGRVLKFVPASGAASRMFKHLHQAADTLRNGEKVNDPAFDAFIAGLKRFAFYADLEQQLKAAGHELTELLEKQSYLPILDALLGEDAMNYSGLPKGLLQFHSYDDDAVRTPVEEHFEEALRYAADGDGVARLHFTVSPEHRELFEQLCSKLCDQYADKGVTIEVNFSEQKPSTNTIAVNPDNTPFRTESGELLFRPGGHGALLENLNDLAGDLIFVKNIDNVVPDRLKDETVLYKKALAGLLVRVQFHIFNYLRWLDEHALDPQRRNEIASFITQKLRIDLPTDFASYPDEEAAALFTRTLNRPIRVCGMVKNEGEPGGGPFWVFERDGSLSRQIVESSQINLDEEQQQEILAKSTHFNPVDLVCGVRDYCGYLFDLRDWSDPDACFISSKSMSGKSLKALELPGLWNGAMAKWITLFVEVPLITFNPVKTVNDLLRDQHQ